ncbi:hypothetical protein Tco_1086113 [Tanacetum coccineum]
MSKTAGYSSKNDNIITFNSYSTLNEEEDVENVHDENANLFPNTKTGGSSSFTAVAGEKEKSSSIQGLEASKCQLFISYETGTMKVLYVIGMVYPAKQVHGKSVLQGHVKVHVDNVEADYKDYVLPVPTKEFSKKGEIVLSFV